VDFFERCQLGLAPGGLICVKENITKTGVDMDSEDSSVTRYDNNVFLGGVGMGVGGPKILFCGRSLKLLVCSPLIATNSETSVITLSRLHVNALRVTTETPM